MSDDTNIWTRGHTIPWVRLTIVPSALLGNAIGSLVHGIGLAAGVLLVLAATGFGR